jgi:nucleoside diphosphate kinase
MSFVGLKLVLGLFREVLRQKVCGATDPKAAEPGSLRNLLLLNKESLGLVEVDKGSNGTFKCTLCSSL